MVAVLYLFMTLFRLGFLLDLLSKPIISAFLTAGAMIISSSQVGEAAVHFHLHALELELLALVWIFAWC